jgi:hypothetical protein
VNFAVTADEDEGLGFYAGLEAGIGNINKAAYGSDREYYIMPMVIYEQAFLNGILDVFAELDYTLGFTKISDGKKEVYPQSLYFDLLLAYNLGMGSASTLSFFLENEFDELEIAPSSNKENNITGIFTPAVNFNQEFDFGDIYARAGFPITYIHDDKKADTEIGVDFTLGWYSVFGLGLEAKALTQLVPGDDRDYLGLEVLASYETDTMYFEVLAEIPKEIEDGVTVTPEFDYYFKNFTFYIYCEFSGIGGGSVRISPALGVKYSF